MKKYIEPKSYMIKIDDENIIATSDPTPRFTPTENSDKMESKSRNSAFSADYSLSDGWE